MSSIKVKLVSFSEASPEVFNTGKRTFLSYFPEIDNFEFTDENPDIIYFLSGGSERSASAKIADENPVCFLASNRNNSFASAVETKAFLIAKGVRVQLLNEDSDSDRRFLALFVQSTLALRRLHDKKLGLIGNISEWLIASHTDSSQLTKKTGIRLMQIPWNTIPAYSEKASDESFIKLFDEFSDTDLSDASRVHRLLSETVEKYRLDAITVECFPLVRQHAVTACLSLAKFNNENFPAGCEGDIPSATGMMLAKELTGIVPWMANLNKISDETCMFSHCTTAPSFLDDIKIVTHFETGLGTAVQGDLKAQFITVFRFDADLNRMFLSAGEITARPHYATACRTQIEVKLPQNDSRILHEKPLGNHHLILPGDFREILRAAAFVIGIEILKPE